MLTQKDEKVPLGFGHVNQAGKGNNRSNSAGTVMFDFLGAFRKKKEKIDRAEVIKNPSPDDCLLPAETNIPSGKRCPKCAKQFPLMSVICDKDSTLLMLIKYAAPTFQQTVIANRLDGTEWELRCESFIGKGTICEVYEFRDVAADEKYVAKTLMLSVLSDIKSARKFMEGVSKALSLQHENIVRTFARGVVKGTGYSGEDQSPFIVCEYSGGQQLSKRLDKQNIPSVTETLTIAQQVCAALEHAHQQGIIHGDLKPSNIFVESNGDTNIVKVSDFAIAERLFQGLEWKQVSTITTSTYGCSTYLAPDYVHSRTPTAVADIYSLGCIMYECLTGRPPFVCESDFLTIMKHVDEPPMPFSADYTPKPVAEIVMKALEKDPRKRWLSATEMREAIEEAM